MTFNSNNTLYPIRLIPLDLGYAVQKNHLSKIKKFCSDNNFIFKEDITLFGVNVLMKINFDSKLSVFIFSDGVCIFLYYDTPYQFNQIHKFSVQTVLDERQKSHIHILEGTHLISEQITHFTQFARNLVREKRRRFTSLSKWENKGLSYVMSFYIITSSPKHLKDDKFINSIYSLLYTDNHTYKQKTYKKIENDRKKCILKNHDLIDGTHVCLSWANFIILSSKKDIDFDYFISMEVALQHIWMYSYITEQILDNLLQKEKYKSKELKKLYNTIMSMIMIVKKYNSIISSTTHEREYQLFKQLKISSKLDILENSINEKSVFLKDKMEWNINNKRLRRDKHIELLIIILTLLQVMTSFGIDFKDMLKFDTIIPFVILIIPIIIYRTRI